MAAVGLLCHACWCPHTVKGCLCVSYSFPIQVWDLEHTGQPFFDVQAHASIVNQLDGFGGQVGGCGRWGPMI